MSPGMGSTQPGDKAADANAVSSCPVSPKFREGFLGAAGRPPSAAPPPGGATASSAACASEELDTANNMPTGQTLNQKWMYATQQQPLSTQRVESNIVRSTSKPSHQPDGTEKWVYPSEQMFFNAMKRKGYDPKEQDMNSVVAIHNAVNERTWSEVMKWEAMHATQCGDVKLARFQGRPTDPSPRARLYTLLGYNAPFDRHDWYIDRCGTQVRYVIDFYRGSPRKEGDSRPVGFYIDARPAIDTPEALVDRVKMALRELWPF